MTKERTMHTPSLREIEARCKAATEGPWSDQGEYRMKGEVSQIVGAIDGDCDDGVWRQICTEVCEIADNDDHDANSAFIRHAITDVPYLLSLLREAEQALVVFAKAGQATASAPDMGFGFRDEDTVLRIGSGFEEGAAITVADLRTAARVHAKIAGEN